MTFQSSDLDQLKAALLTGALTISSNGRTVTFHSLSDIKKTIREIEAVIAQQEATEENPVTIVPNRIQATFSKYPTK